MEVDGVADFPGVDESEDAGVEVAVLHASKLRAGRAEATLAKNGDGTPPSHRHEVAPAPCTGKGCGSARASQRGRAALASGRPARCVTRQRADQLLADSKRWRQPARRKSRGASCSIGFGAILAIHPHDFPKTPM